MAPDVYDPCPCGSGKKLKFCCHVIVGEMEKVVKLRENNQPRMALQVLEGLQKQHEGNPWLETSRASILLEEYDSDEAKQILLRLLERHPDHLFALALLAVVSFTTDGLEEARVFIHRAFQRCSRAHPGLISQLAMGLAAFMQLEGHVMAARQHLALALKLAPRDSKQAIFLRLLDFDNSRAIPYPLRSVHELSNQTVADSEADKAARNAFRLAEIGCFEPAAKIYAKLAADTGSEPGAEFLWQNAGICHAWSGNDVAAAAALHRAARLHSDFETAVEFETIAQLLDLDRAGESAEITEKPYLVDSVSKLLTRLDDQPRFIRVNRADDVESDEDVPTAVFQILNRQPLQEITIDSAIDEVPYSLAQASIFAELPEDERPAEAILVGLESDLAEAAEFFAEIAGELVSETEAPKDEEAIHETVPKEYLPLQVLRYFGSEISGKRQRELQSPYCDRFLNEEWPNSQVTGLCGKTPEEAIGDSESALPLAASLYVLDAMCDRYHIPFDPAAAREQYQLEPIAPVEIDETASLSSFSVMRLHRVPVKTLTDAQLLQTLNRALLLHNNRYLHRVLAETESRPTCMQEVDSDRIYGSLTELARDSGDYPVALQWVARAFELSQSKEDAFQDGLRWKLRELVLRLDDPSDPELNPLLCQLWDYYGSKLPSLREHLQRVVAMTEYTPPWETDAGIVTADAAAAANLDSGVWTPSSSPSEEKKLWLPGQD